MRLQAYLLPNVSRSPEREATAAIFGNRTCCLKYSGRFLWAAAGGKMTQEEKIAALLGQISDLEKEAARLSGALASFSGELKKLKQQLSGPQSPYGVIYPFASKK